MNIRSLGPASVAMSLALVLTACGPTDSTVGTAAGSRPRQHVPLTATMAARAFLDRYVAADGRVVRRDQGGDTVSEGQGYGLLLAVVADRPAEFRRIWVWTRQHLADPDRLLAWRWAHGRVSSHMPASDADLDVTWALALAARRFHTRAYLGAAHQLTVAMSRREVAWRHGLPLFVAGPWARGDAGVVAPGYLAFPALARMTTLSPNPLLWKAILRSSIRVL
ncbi:MAG: glycosyl hydrolase family 8, partial [Nocardioidaceae bacterium]